MGAPKGTKPWNAGKSQGWINPRGYRIVSRVINGKRHQIREHREIMEKHLGRKLEPWEVVHHKDHNPLNNALENLEVLTFGEHTTEHHQGARKNYDARKTMEAFAQMREELKRCRSTGADLLAALQSIADKADEMGNSPDTAQRGLWQGCAEQARAAIAKATQA